MQLKMVIRIIAVVGALVIVAAILFFIVVVIQQNIKHKKDLETLRTNYSQLQKIQKAEHEALLKRDKDYQAARKQHESQVNELTDELDKARANDKCIDKKLPIDVSIRLRQPSSINKLSRPKPQFATAN